MNKRQTLRDLANECEDVEFISLRGRYALVRLANGLGGEARLVSREWLEGCLDEADAMREVKN